MWLPDPRCGDLATSERRVVHGRMSPTVRKCGMRRASLPATRGSRITTSMPMSFRQNDRRRRAAGRVVGRRQGRAQTLARRLRDAAAVLARRRRRRPIPRPPAPAAPRRQSHRATAASGCGSRPNGGTLRLSCPRRRPPAGHRRTGAERVGQVGPAGAAIGRPHRLAANHRSAHGPARDHDRRRQQLHRRRPLAAIAAQRTSRAC